jgi:hypothetical protein
LQVVIDAGSVVDSEYPLSIKKNFGMAGEVWLSLCAEISGVPFKDQVQFIVVRCAVYLYIFIQVLLIIADYYS